MAEAEGTLEYQVVIGGLEGGGGGHPLNCCRTDVAQALGNGDKPTMSYVALQYKCTKCVCVRWYVSMD